MKNANLLSKEFNIKLVNEPESVSRVSKWKEKSQKEVENGRKLHFINGQ